ncbi:LysM peptidoglycan-binding domain-containing protein [Mycobacterium sp. TY814]|uniref:LysM peptidoglycan-binding domain-containing protein n=1 Tax=unclassified Mycobacterium TaxID=2642494 RepID=UPI000F9C9288|nr:LysM peptidoglycan-binding domain-containing protein [Mycobacterium sp. TY814]MDP7721225.1 LysM peptidoglycan-binding domain-containing protein [Mycobacterium sp. TY814]RUP02187.1 MAG: LysM peptidoglycan-binding domain-containing protein [Mycobacterium sp.]
MTISYAGPQRTWNGQRLVTRPANRPFDESPYYRAGQIRSTRPGPTRPGGTPMRYHGTGVAVSTASHRRRPVSVLTTVGLALLAGIITLWLGLMANFGSVLNDEPAEAAAQVPAALAVVRVEPGESLQQLASRVAPGAPVRDVVERIRNLNALDSNSVAAGQTLIAPIG